jgi:hypothetical protein
MKKIQTKKVRFVNANTLIVTIDIGKTTSFGYCQCPGGDAVSYLFKYLDSSVLSPLPILYQAVQPRR